MIEYERKNWTWFLPSLVLRDPFPRVFNDCNIKELKSYLSSGGGKCLFNLPNTRTMYGGHRCGNGYLEDGEECDCGEEEVSGCFCVCTAGFSFDGFARLHNSTTRFAQECTSPCCNANNCTLKAGAECAHGVCCQNCKVHLLVYILFKWEITNPYSH